jgi:CheY-like chemotaxis protein
MASILVADDDPISQRWLGYILGDLGHDVRTAANGRIALAQLSEAPSDAVILDLAMPEMDGLTALRRLRTDERYRELPVIMLTASGLDRDARMARQAGASEVLTKPCRTHELADALQRVLPRT